MQRRTKIVCTIGPATSSETDLQALIEAGMNVARLNFAHGDHAQHGVVLARIRTLAERLDVPVPVLQDLAGPKVRIGAIAGGSITLEAGHPLVLTTAPVEGSTSRVSVSYPNLPREVRAGDALLLADGSIQLRVEGVTDTEIQCRVVVGGRLSSRKGVNVPSGLSGLPILGEKDLDDLRFGLEQGVDYVGLSFLYVYHCATPMVANHVSSGMYGLILVEPAGGLPPVDREFYVMQGELYTDRPFGQRGHDEFSVEKLLAERAEYFVFNGAVGALTTEYPMKARVGETVRIFFGVGGPNATSSFHVIGEIFDRVYQQAAIGSPPATNVQTTTVPAGGATIVEFTLEVPGRYILVDHALSRVERGLAGFLVVDGAENPDVFHGDVATSAGH